LVRLASQAIIQFLSRRVVEIFAEKTLFFDPSPTAEPDLFFRRFYYNRRKISFGYAEKD
jgi:hypothetical protein